MKIFSAIKNLFVRQAPVIEEVLPVELFTTQGTPVSELLQRRLARKATNKESPLNAD